MIVGLACVIISISACIEDPTLQPGPGSSSDLRPTAPVSPTDRTARFAVLGSPATLDPYSPLASNLTYALARPLYPSLFKLLPDGTAEPYLAESIESSTRSATVRLREALWSDGEPIVARDVVASVARAQADPASGFEGLHAEARGPSIVRLTGRVRDWDRTLARRALVLPRGREGEVTGGPFSLARHVPGLKLVYERAAWWGPPAILRRVTVFYVEQLDTMLTLLGRERLEGASTPMSVNLDDRLGELELGGLESTAQEVIYLDTSEVDAETSARFLGAIRQRALADGFVRDDGFVSTRPVARSSPPTGTLQLSAPVGDELLQLLQRAIWEQTHSRSLELELVTVDAQTFYGRWTLDDPTDLSLRRGYMDEVANDGNAHPLFVVESIVAVRPELQGVRVNPTVEGPLWNMEEWFIDPSI